MQARPCWKSSAAVRFAGFAEGAAAVRELAQSGLWPANCRLLDPAEAAVTGSAGPDSEGVALLVLGFESADHPVDAWMARALECCAAHGGTCPDGAHSIGPGSDEGAAKGGDSVRAWRSAFLQAPYVRDTMVAAGVLSETFETAITWDRLEAFVADARTRVEAAVREACGSGRVTCRFTHAYPDGAAPYFTVLAPARRGAELEQWGTIKVAASEAIAAAGGSITHHHAVGRDHRPWYDAQRPDPFAAALTAAKSAVDPDGLLNPGVLIG